jgi:putative phosphoesterase
MRLGILSDIHDNVWKLNAALSRLVECDVLLCCGDLCSPFVIDELANSFPRDIHIVFGNNDADLFRITSKTKTHTHVKLAGEFFEGTFDGKRVAMNHFDYLAKPIAQSGLYDLVCFGHNHVLEIATLGRTLAINPGPIMGAKFSPQGRVDCASTFVIFDTATNSPEVFEVDGGNEVKPFWSNERPHGK